MAVDLRIPLTDAAALSARLQGASHSVAGAGMGRTIKRLSREERSESVIQYAMLAVFLTGMIGVTLYSMSGALWNFMTVAGLE